MPPGKTLLKPAKKIPAAQAAPADGTPAGTINSRTNLTSLIAANTIRIQKNDNPCGVASSDGKAQKWRGRG